MQARTADRDRIAKRVQHGDMRKHLIAPPTAEMSVNPRVRPELTTPLSRLGHEEVWPRAQVARGSIPRAARGMHGSTATRVPTECGQSDPASIIRTEISWPNPKVSPPRRVQGG